MPSARYHEPQEFYARSAPPPLPLPAALVPGYSEAPSHNISIRGRRDRHGRGGSLPEDASPAIRFQRSLPRRAATTPMPGAPSQPPEQHSRPSLRQNQQHSSAGLAGIGLHMLSDSNALPAPPLPPLPADVSRRPPRPQNPPARPTPESPTVPLRIPRRSPTYEYLAYLDPPPANQVPSHPSSRHRPHAAPQPIQHANDRHFAVIPHPASPKRPIIKSRSTSTALLDPLGEGERGTWPVGAYPVPHRPAPPPPLPSHRHFNESSRELSAARYRTPVDPGPARSKSLGRTATRDLPTGSGGSRRHRFPHEVDLFSSRTGSSFAMVAQSWGDLLRLIGSNSETYFRPRPGPDGYERDFPEEAALVLEFQSDSEGYARLRLKVTLPRNLMSTPHDLSVHTVSSPNSQSSRQVYYLPTHPVFPFTLGSITNILVQLRHLATIASSSKPSKKADLSYKALRILGDSLRKLEDPEAPQGKVGREQGVRNLFVVLISCKILVAALHLQRFDLVSKERRLDQAPDSDSQSNNHLSTLPYSAQIHKPAGSLTLPTTHEERNSGSSTNFSMPPGSTKLRPRPPSFSYDLTQIHPSCTLLPSSLPTSSLPRAYYLSRAPTNEPGPILAVSPFIPLALARHLMNAKRNLALGRKYVEGSHITNGEGALHTFVTAILPVKLHGDTVYRGGHTVLKFRTKKGKEQYRPVVLSTQIHLDFETREVGAMLYCVEDDEIVGVPLGDGFVVLDGAAKQNEEERGRYDARLKAHAVFHLTHGGRLPPLGALKETAMTVKQAVHMLEKNPPLPSFDPHFLRDTFVISSAGVLSLEMMGESFVASLVNELSVLELICPTGYTYLYNPPAIFARHLPAQLTTRLMLHALLRISMDNDLRGLRTFALDTFGDPASLDFAQAILSRAKIQKPQIRVMDRAELFGDSGHLSECDAGSLVVHNNSDGFGQNIEFEGSANVPFVSSSVHSFLCLRYRPSSLDGVLGVHSSAAAGLSRVRQDLMSHLV